jgi:hypothetical protein
MAKYKLLERSVIDGQVLEVGTEIGEGTPFPFNGRPGPHMAPLDSSARLAVKAAMDNLPHPDQSLTNHPEDRSMPGTQMRRP